MGVSATTHLQLSGHGARRISTSEEALPAHKNARMVCIAALASNGGTVFIGLSGVTSTTGADNETCGWALGPGDVSPWIPCPDGGLAGVFLIASAINQDITFMWLS